jgi:hypothetical protein
MATQLSESDHRGFDKLLGAILTRHEKGEVTTPQAKAALARVFEAATIDDSRVVDSWSSTPKTLANWKSIVDPSRS